MRIFVCGIIIILNLILQSTLLQGIEIRGIIPNTAVVLIVSYSLLRGRFEGMIFGCFIGLMQDIFFSDSLTYYALLGGMCGYFVGRVNKNFYRENFFLPLVVTFAAVNIYGTLIYIFGFLINNITDFLYFYNNIILPESVYSSMTSLVIYLFFHKINDAIEKREKYNRKIFGRKNGKLFR